MRVFGAIILIAAVLTVVVPQFTNCSHEGKMITTNTGAAVPMKCFWTAQAAIATGIPLFALGTALAASRRKETRRMLSMLGAIMGAFIIALPTTLIGVCGNMVASCNLVMRPSLISLGVVVLASSLGALLVSQRSVEGSVESGWAGAEEHRG